MINQLGGYLNLFMVINIQVHELFYSSCIADFFLSILRLNYMYIIKILVRDFCKYVLTIRISVNNFFFASAWFYRPYFNIIRITPYEIVNYSNIFLRYKIKFLTVIRISLSLLWEN